jgi:FtsZ-binding cell division protein ZapB
MDDRFTSLEKRMDDRFINLEKRMENRFDKLEEKVDRLEEKVTILEVEVRTIKEDVKELKTQSDETIKKVADLSGVNSFIKPLIVGILSGGIVALIRFFPYKL